MALRAFCPLRKLLVGVDAPPKDVFQTSIKVAG
jgi:hypothetical protein